MIYGVDLYWLPLGAGGHFVRLIGRIYEACDAAIHRRSRYDLYHSALEVQAPSGRFVIEQTPVPDGRGDRRGVVAEAAVGSRSAARLRVFRYEIRRWRDGVIPDLSEAVDSPHRLTKCRRFASCAARFGSSRHIAALFISPTAAGRIGLNGPWPTCQMALSHHFLGEPSWLRRRVT